MHISTLAHLVVPLFAASVVAQTFHHNRIEFGNFWTADREDLFPNYLRPGGNVAGDGVFKVIPRELLERSGTHRISGYFLGISIDNAFTGPFPTTARLPAMQVFRTKIQSLGGVEYEVPDLSAPVGPRYDPVTIFLQSDGPWVVEIAFDPGAFNPKLQQLLPVSTLVNGQRTGLAVMALAEPGQTRSPSQATIVLQASFNERHLAPGRSSYSGTYNAATNSLAMYGQVGQPSATGEFYAGLRFDNPTLQLFGSSSGGIANDPQNWETHLGPGAYATDLATRGRPGFFGIYVQGLQYHNFSGPPTHRVFPLVVAIGAGPTTDLALGAVSLRVDPGSLSQLGFLLQAGLFGPLATYAKQGSAGWDEDQLGAYASPRFQLLPSPVLIGIDLWIQGVIADANMNLVNTTNAVRMTLR